MRFTKTEIDLCHQIARVYRKPINYGDWYVGREGNIKSWQCKYKTTHNDLIPLWQISDCLEFLQNKFEKVSFNLRERLGYLFKDTLNDHALINAFKIDLLKSVLECGKEYILKWVEDEMESPKDFNERIRK